MNWIELKYRQRNKKSFELIPTGRLMDFSLKKILFGCIYSPVRPISSKWLFLAIGSTIFSCWNKKKTIKSKQTENVFRYADDKLLMYASWVEYLKKRRKLAGISLFSSAQSQLEAMGLSCSSDIYGLYDVRASSIFFVIFLPIRMFCARFP